MACPYFAGECPQLDKESKESKEMEVPSLYDSYLDLPNLLNAQHPRSGKNGKAPVHDEHLFIITHQATELWFKQIVHEIDSVRKILETEEQSLLVVVSRIRRVDEIMKVITSHFSILETMTSQDFFEFRDLLAGGSGFQSLSFRLLENKLGLLKKFRLVHNGESYEMVFTEENRDKLMRSETEKSLLDLVNSWLERAPGSEEGVADFFTKFKSNVEDMFDENDMIAKATKTPTDRQRQLRNNEKNRSTFETLFDKNVHDDLVKKGNRRFSHKAMQGALMIFMYREEPRFHLPFQLLQSLTNLDDSLNKMRYVHASMTQRMIGNKYGAGDSSGYHFLRATCGDRYRIFKDLITLPSFLVPRDRIPSLDEITKLSIED